MLDMESLYNLSYGMCIITSRSDEEFNGCTVNTAFQITPDPPVIAVSVNKESQTHDFIMNSRLFVVSIISEDAPMILIGSFGFRSGRDIDKFRDIHYKLSENGIPIILDYSVGYIEAEVINSVDVGTHTLFLGEIKACRTIDETKAPMTYSYYRDVKGGRTPRSAATYIERKSENQQGAKKMKYKCLMCGYIYDPAVGDPDSGIEPGTAFDDIPDDWVCPDCGVGKDEFEPVED